jgi:hypothetical protein
MKYKLWLKYLILLQYFKYPWVWKWRARSKCHKSHWPCQYQDNANDNPVDTPNGYPPLW